MQNPLLVSDLDGTLLDSKKRVPPRTVAAVNAFVAEGGLFTVATARMPFGCRARLADLDLRLPAVVMNGAGLYSFAAEEFVHAFPMSPASVAAAAAAIENAGADAFVYGIADRRLVVGYTGPEALEWSQYNSDAAQAEHAPFTELGRSGWTRLGEILYLAVVGSAAQLGRVQESISTEPGCRALPYRNVYTETDCLEISSPEAGKENALQVLRELVPSDGLVAFGDNLNDLEMMAMADLSFAPENAVEVAREAADELIPSNDDDGVGRLIEQRYLG